MPAFRLVRRIGSVDMSCLLSLALIALSGSVSAQVFRAEAPNLPGPVLAEASVDSPETVRLLTGLAKIESDLQLGLLFLKDGLSNPQGSHFSDPLAETYPDIRDGLAAAGVADFEPQLAALAAGGSKGEVMAAYGEAVGALILARSALQPSPRDLLLSIVEQTRAVVGEINPAGPTEAASYQDAWAMLMVARNQIDLLVRNGDPATVEAAKSMALTFDEVILSMPDPATSAPVAFDPAPILNVITVLEGLVGSA